MVSHAARGPRRSRRVVPAVLAVLVVVLGFVWLRVGGELAAARAEAGDRRAAVRAAERYALGLMAVDYRTIDRDVRRVLDTSTGQARQEYAGEAGRLKSVTVRHKAIQTGVVRAAGLAAMDGARRTARVLVVADSVIRWDGARTAPQERFHRWSIEVTKVGGSWWVSRLEQVS
ncbi:hypothetical protein Sru01_47950 [Sphaerisporangium rufum]|uniref:Mce-associated membrane protein n=1 Tax=Sphaerisporangium rufum TaxID=1381558 RepID=A0A919V393_9ACTN|nr:hypothetical protein [Sphaerisporangium rufum]GII79813.1 hypothetical protein Sru01_47950 [Sphaerisporangium rufum]